MSTTPFFIGDLHFGHSRLATEWRGFASIEEHDEFIIDRWNRVVRPKDMVWVLGDVAMRREAVAQIARCNGHKKLIMGNHDTFPIEYYLPHFDSILGVRRAYHGMVLSHVPVHPSQLEYRWKANIHGHIHDPSKYDLGPGYINVCADAIHFRPVPLDTIKEIVGDEK